MRPSSFFLRGCAGVALSLFLSAAVPPQAVAQPRRVTLSLAKPAHAPDARLGTTIRKPAPIRTSPMVRLHAPLHVVELAAIGGSSSEHVEVHAVEASDAEVPALLEGYHAIKASVRAPMDERLRLAISTAKISFDNETLQRPYFVRSPKRYLPPEEANAVHWTEKMLEHPEQVSPEVRARPLHFIRRDAYASEDGLPPKLARLGAVLGKKVVVVESQKNDTFNRAEFEKASEVFDASIPVERLEQAPVGVGVAPANRPFLALSPRDAHRSDATIEALLHELNSDHELSIPEKVARLTPLLGGRVVVVQNGTPPAPAKPGDAKGVITASVEQGSGNGRSKEFHPVSLASAADLKGMEKLHEYVSEQRSAATMSGLAFGADLPKGMLLVGPPGTGKSKSAEVIARALKRPLYRLNGADYNGSLEGQSERNLAAILKAFEGKDIVLHIDEVEKLFPDASVKTNSNGVQEACLQILLPFMAENQHIYFVFTANGATVAPELIRAGRLDATFYVGLPERKTREAIVASAFARRGWKVASADLKRAGEVTQGYSGAELEQIAKNVIQRVNHDTQGQGAPNGQHLLDAIKELSPASLTHKKTIDALRAWATDVHARDAGGPRTDNWLPSGGILELAESTVGAEDLGGFGAFKTWMSKQASITKADVEKRQLKKPKGVMLVGIPGAGKTLAAQIAATLLKRPLLRFRFSKLLEDPSHGAVERSLKQALKEIKEAGETVVLLDEFDKMIELRQQSPLAAAELLDFMNSQTDTFFAATANDLSRVPIENLRTGRFDKIWFVDLPTHSERKFVFHAVLSRIDRRNIEIYGRDLDALARASAGFTPAEIKQSVNEAMTSAAYRYKAASKAERAGAQLSRLATVSDILHELGTITPESIKMGDKFQQMREVARELGTPVSDERDERGEHPHGAPKKNPIGFMPQ